MALLTGRVRYRPLPAIKLPYGPVHARVRRDGTIDWIVDEAQIDPILGNALAEASTAMIATIPTLPPTTRPTHVRWHRDRTIGGSELFIADIDADVINVMVPRDLVTRDVAMHVGLHATVVLQTLLRTMPVIGEGSTPAHTA
ncbi:hypothetical protein AB0F17_58550 [Nonomuraea sp. NPDC026600]|uniref:hypothetical protein n=1 Tax=Nonomuraea sp. NPDC026600 TaxID=3155363 RepID=UPI0033E0BA97